MSPPASSAMLKVFKMTYKEYIHDISISIAGLMVVWNSNLSDTFMYAFIALLFIHFATEKRDE